MQDEVRTQNAERRIEKPHILHSAFCAERPNPLPPGEGRRGAPIAETESLQCSQRSGGGGGRGIIQWLSVQGVSPPPPPPPRGLGAPPPPPRCRAPARPPPPAPG